MGQSNGVLLKEVAVRISEVSLYVKKSQCNPVHVTALFGSGT